jgi:putative MATE family efflux protein
VPKRTTTTVTEAEHKLGHSSIPRLALSLSLPAVVAQMANALYTIVDRLFIARIPGTGTVAMTAIGICFPITLLLSAIAALIGAGGAPLASIELGRGNFKKAERIVGTCTATLIVTSIVFIVIGQLFKEPLLLAFGASPDTLPYASTFLSIYLYGTVFVQLALGLVPFISAQGRAKVAMCATLAGTLTSFLLDPLFIFVFDWGIAGAAWANVLAQSLSALIACYFLMSGRSGIRLRLHLLRYDSLLLPSLALGASPFIVQITEGAIAVVFNAMLEQYGGDTYVSAMTIILSLEQLVFVFSNGLAQGIQPIIGYNFGARAYSRVRQAYRIGFTIDIGVTTLAAGLCILFPAPLADLFTTDPVIIDIVARKLPVFMLGFGYFGIQNATQYALLGMGQARPCLFLSLWRKVILLIPLALLLPRFLGADGVFAAEPIADIVSATTAIFIFRHTVRRLIPAASKVSTSQNLVRGASWR